MNQTNNTIFINLAGKHILLQPCPKMQKQIIQKLNRHFKDFSISLPLTEIDEM